MEPTALRPTMSKIIIVCILLVSSAYSFTLKDIFEKQLFCGNRLDAVMTDLCDWQPEETSTYETARRRRNIISECCQEPCTMKYILDFYCSKPKSKYMSISKIDAQDVESLMKLNLYPSLPPVTESSYKKTYKQIQKQTMVKRRPSGKLKKKKKSLHNKSKTNINNLKNQKRCSCKQQRKVHKKRFQRSKPIRPPVIGYKVDDRPIIVMKKYPF